MALDFHPCVMNFVLRDGLKSELARFAVSFKVTRVPSCGPDLKKDYGNINGTIAK